MATVSGVPIIGGITFNFTEGGYSPPTWSGGVYSFGGAAEELDCYTAWVESNIGQWTECNQDQWNVCFNHLLNQIWSDNNYVYAAITFGMDIISMSAEQKIAYIEHKLGFNTVWANNTRVYVGTTFSGIKYFNKTCVSGTVGDPNNLITCLVDYSSPFGISSQTIRYIHGSGDDYLMCVTTAGVDVYHMKMTKYRSTHSTTHAQKCFMTSNGKFYYTSVSGSEWSLNRVDKPLWDWTIPDYIYNTGGDILPAGLKINDIFITENTASNTIDNTVFIATTSGVFVVDEGNSNYVVYYTGG